MSSKVANHTCVFFPSVKEKGYSAKKHLKDGWWKAFLKTLEGKEILGNHNWFSRNMLVLTGSFLKQNLCSWKSQYQMSKIR